jgi:hypothetical protein
MADIRPVRLQLSRRKGFNLQALSRETNGLPAVKVDRSTEFGNPYQAGQDGDGDPAYLVRLFREYMARDEETATRARHDLRGKNLACWCKLCARHAERGKPLDEDCADCAPCHTDPLGRIANRPICEEVTP